MDDERSRASTEPLRREVINEMSASILREARVGMFKEDLTAE